MNGINLPLFILDFILLLPVTLLRLALIYLYGSRYEVPGLSFIDVMMHSDQPRFNTEEVATEVRSVKEVIRETLTESEAPSSLAVSSRLSSRGSSRVLDQPDLETPVQTLYTAQNTSRASFTASTPAPHLLQAQARAEPTPESQASLSSRSQPPTSRPLNPFQQLKLNQSTRSSQAPTGTQTQTQTSLPRSTQKNLPHSSMSMGETEASRIEQMIGMMISQSSDPSGDSGISLPSFPSDPSGQSGWTSGKTGQTSGKTGQTSGKTGQTSGKTGQTSGKTGQTSGKTGKTSGKSGKTSKTARTISLLAKSKSTPPSGSGDLSGFSTRSKTSKNSKDSKSSGSTIPSQPNYDIFHRYGTHATMTQTDESSPTELELDEEYGNLRPSATSRGSRGSSTSRRVNIMFTDGTTHY